MNGIFNLVNHLRPLSIVEGNYNDQIWCYQLQVPFWDFIQNALMIVRMQWFAFQFCIREVGYRIKILKQRSLTRHFLMVFLIPSRNMPAKHLKLIRNRFLPHSLQLIFRNQPYVQCYKKSVGRKAYLNKPETFDEVIAQLLNKPNGTKSIFIS